MSHCQRLVNCDHDEGMPSLSGDQPFDRCRDSGAHAVLNMRQFTVYALLLAFLVPVDTANAQPYGSGMRGWGWGHDLMGSGMMMGPGMMGHSRGMCSNAAAGFVGWRIDGLELIITPTEAQRSKFEELKAASKARLHPVDIIRDAT